MHLCALCLVLAVKEATQVWNMMSGCGVRSCRRWGEQKGFQKNKNKIKTSLWQAFKGSRHIQEQLFKKTQSLPFCSWLSQGFKRGVMDGLEAAVVKTPPVHRDTVWPQSLCKQLPQRSRKLSHPSWNSCPLGRKQQLLHHQQWLAEEDKGCTFAVWNCREGRALQCN